ncbi:MAG: acetyl-CoA C-acetyltransferase, partial [Oligoflexia bacterium]|nr:acetyl-CoA C-acetyltransferase [Oligoflexia bacterium]
TAANASTINDAAAAVVLAKGQHSARNDAKNGGSIFRVVAFASHAQDPAWFTLAPIGAIQKCLQRARLTLSDINFFEINEAFACVPLAAIKELNISPEKVNIYGGAISLGHPIGCSGTRIVVTLMNALTRQNARYGMATLCIGGGEALAMIIEKV